MNKRVWAILAKEFKSDFRNPYALAGALLFLLCSLFVTYLSFKRINVPATWVALFWIVILFSSFSLVGKGLKSSTRGAQLYQYTLYAPSTFISAQIIYNLILMLVFGAIGFLFFWSMHPVEVQNLPLLLTTILLGCTALAIVLTLLSNIASKAGGNLTLMTILSLPVLLPLIGVVIILSKNSIDGLAMSTQWRYLFVLSGLNVTTLALSVILFPYLWRE